MLATLIRLLGDFELAEEARQEACAAALESWPVAGTPGNPRAWLISTGRHRIIDRLRRDQVFHQRVAGLITDLQAAPSPAQDLDDARFGDDRLRLIFTCCHPALNPEARIALTLHAVCALPTHAVARAFLTSEATMAQRLIRAKRKIREARIPYDTPAPHRLDERLDGVLAVIYSVFTEGYAATRGASLIDVELCAEAIRLGYLLDSLVPGQAAVLGLLGLMLLHDARRDARQTPEGDLVLLEEQDRGRWDPAKIAAGLALVDGALAKRGVPSPYAVQAAIAALHARAATPQATDWRQIAGLYEVLLRLQPSPIIELNHAVAVSMVDGAQRALDLVESLAARGEVSQYHLLHAARARFLEQLGRTQEALLAYGSALAGAQLAPERRFLAARMAAIDGRQWASVWALPPG